jgi:YVTN family beta-propeller protein
VSGVAAASGRVVATLKAGQPPRGGDQGVSAAIAGAGSIWVVRGDENAVYRIDPATGRTVSRIPVGDTPGPGTFAAGSVWITNLTGNSVSRIDPATNRVVATIATGVQPAYAVGNGGAVWVTDFGGDGLTRIDPATNRTRDVRVCYGPAGLAATAGALWVACPSAHELVRVAI